LLCLGGFATLLEEKFSLQQRLPGIRRQRRQIFP